MTKERHDAILMEILNDKKTLSGFLQSVFGFLSSRTDFYFEKQCNDDKMGFPSGFKEQLVLQIMKQFETKKINSMEAMPLLANKVKVENVDYGIIGISENPTVDWDNYEIQDYNSLDNANYFEKPIDNLVLNEIFDKSNKKLISFINLHEEPANLNKKLELKNQKNEPDFNILNDVSPTNKNDFVKIPEGYRCLICMKIFKNKSAITAHLDSHLEKSMLCFKCGKFFDDKLKAKIHFAVCKRKSKSTNKIDSKITTNQSIVNHNEELLDYDANIKRTKTCPICSKKFCKYILTYDHMNSHTKAKPYICSCGVKMAFYTNLLSHLHKFKCSLNGVSVPKYCNFGIKKKRKLTEKKESPIFCKICNLRFFKNDAIKHFSTEEHLIKEKEWIKKYDVKKYICHVCEINLDNILKLIVHEIEEHKTIITSKFFMKFQRHSKHCDICNKTFAKRIHYFDHMNAHNNIQPYICSCGTKAQYYQTFIDHFQKKGCSIEGRIFPNYCPKTFQTSVGFTVAKT